MLLKAIEASTLTIPFHAAFKHATAERRTTQTLWVTAHGSGGAVGHGEGCPREYVTSESLSTAHSFVAQNRSDWLDSIRDFDTLSHWTNRHRAEIDSNPAAWAAVELAILDLIGKETGRSVESVLELPEINGRFCYTAVIGDGSPEQFNAQLSAYLKTGFWAFKIKLSGDPERDATKTQALEHAGVSPTAVRADANNLWSDADTAIRHVDGLGFPFFAVEEPLSPRDYEGMQRIASALDTRIILDESLVRSDQLALLGGPANRWIINLRVSKMGGLLRSLELVSAARLRDLQVIVGAQVGETSLLTRAALTVANWSRDLLIGQEGAFGTHLLTRDVIQPSIMFGPRGELDATSLPVGRGGFSLDIRHQDDYLRRDAARLG